MKYISTRGKTAPKQFSEAFLMGLAEDGGLFMPEHYPQIDEQTLNAWRSLSYPDLAYEIISLFATDIPANDLKQLINNTYTEENFGSTDITPLRYLKDGIIIQELSNGPTLAFKDMAMQFLGNLFEYILAKENKTLNIIGATSGDTGSAAEYALRGKKGIHVFMLSPHGKMSAFQRAQMYSLNESNIHNIAIQGMFDDCQDIVKALQNDKNFKSQYHLSTVNSINWGRIVAQIVYYFRGYLKATQDHHEKISFCVPSGNFGNICAGHIARQMGLPIHRLIVATNENDVLDEFFQTGCYRPRTSDNTWVTSSPSMDISKASNFERFIFDLVERNSSTLCTLWEQVNTGIGFSINPDTLNIVHQQFGFASGKSTHSDRINTIKQVYEHNHDIIDPHTADGVKVAHQLRQKDETIICLETAKAAKFADTIHEALGDNITINRPEKLISLETLPQYVTVMENDSLHVKEYIRMKLA